MSKLSELEKLKMKAIISGAPEKMIERLRKLIREELNRLADEKKE